MFIIEIFAWLFKAVGILFLAMIVFALIGSLISMFSQSQQEQKRKEEAEAWQKKQKEEAEAWQKKQQEEARKARIQELKDNNKTCADQIKYARAAFESGLQAFFQDEKGEIAQIDQNLESQITRMKQVYQSMTASCKELSQLQKTSAAPAALTNASKEVDKCKADLADFRGFIKKSRLDASKMMSPSKYGKENTAFMKRVKEMTPEEAQARLAQDAKQLTGSPAQIYQFKTDKALEYVWYYAMEKPYSATNFKKADKVFQQYYHGVCMDVDIAKLYVKSRLGGEQAIREDVKQLLKAHQMTDEAETRYLETLAAALMWMQAYKLEETVLQHMLGLGLDMSEKLQQRLHILSGGGGKEMILPVEIDTPDEPEVVEKPKKQTKSKKKIADKPEVTAVTEEPVHSVKSKKGKPKNTDLRLDVSALAWKENQYVDLFEQLAFQDKALTYALAVRDEDRGVALAAGAKKPTLPVLHKKIVELLEEEYGEGVAAIQAAAIAMSGSSEEEMKGILITTEECPQLGLLVHTLGIGKKMKAKFYTLFLPAAASATTQRQQALSLYNNLSPSVSMWESSLKETVLLAIQQLLNETPSGGNSAESGSGEGPVF